MKDDNAGFGSLGKAHARTRRDFLRVAAGVAAGLGLAEIMPGPQAQPAPNPFNPPELAHQNGKLQAVIQMVEAQRSYPNGPAKANAPYLRMFQGWYPARSGKSTKPVINPDNAGPGPTLRGKVGGKVEITFLNKVDESKFPYTIDTADGVQYGCDATTPTELYPAVDAWPNCFHGSSTANLHFHGTHVTPDGLGDNVLVQVIPDKNTKESDWAGVFNEVFNMSPTPQSWSAMPKKGYQEKQLGAHHDDPGGLVGAYDKAQAAQAAKDKRKPPKSLWEADQKMVHAGQWPQYVIGAYPNCFQIPAQMPGMTMGQAPGTHWYHAHKHGSTALHILNGLAGAFIIEGDYDAAIKGYYANKVKRPIVENIFVFQNIDSSQNLKRQNPGPNKTGSSQQLINGKNNPTISMQAGEVQWWRIVNATVGGNHGTIQQAVWDTLTGAGFKLMQIAQDGVQFRWENYQSQPFLTKKVPGGLVLAAGNRADILVQAPSTAPSAPVIVNGQPGPGGPIFTVAVRGNDAKMPFITDEGDYPKFPPFLYDLDKPATSPTRTVKFGWDANRTAPGRQPGSPAIGTPPHFTIDGKQFEQNGPKIDQCVELNALEDWLIENHTTVAHPFHIHVNPFQVITINTPGQTPYSPGKNEIWQDTINLPPGKADANGNITPGSVLIRHHFVDFTGTYVLHCHILAHEDRGMMQLVRVTPKGGNCQANIPEHH